MSGSWGIAREDQVPLSVWQNKDKSKDHVACIQQNGGMLGYIPLTDLKVYQGPPVYWNVVPDIVQAHKIMFQSGVLNFFKCYIPVTTQLRLDRWRFHLRNYWDAQLPDLIPFGFT